MELGKNLTKALLAVQKSLDAVAKSGQNPHLKTTYATLPDVLDELLPKCHEAGLVVLQRTLETETLGLLRLETMVIHSETGEMLTMVTPMPVPQTSAQAYGSALTYARRYALMSLFGMRAEDDDAHSATQAMIPQGNQRNPRSQNPAGQNYQTAGIRTGYERTGNGTQTVYREVVSNEQPLQEQVAVTPVRGTAVGTVDALPTDRQMDMLTQLGYAGEVPRTRAEASQIISHLKAHRVAAN